MKPDNFKKFNTNTNNELAGIFGELYTPEEVSGFLKVALSTVYNWAKTGKIECHVLAQGKRKSTIRFDMNQIKQFLQSRDVA